MSDSPRGCTSDSDPDHRDTPPPTHNNLAGEQHTHLHRQRKRSNEWMYGYSQVQGCNTPFFSVNMKGGSTKLSVFSLHLLSHFLLQETDRPTDVSGGPVSASPSQGVSSADAGGSRRPRCDAAATAIPTLTRSLSTAD